jgi:hypothetical protein
MEKQLLVVVEVFLAAVSDDKMSTAADAIIPK